MTLGHAGESVADRYRLDRFVAGTADVEHWQAYDNRLARAVAIRLERESDEADADAVDGGQSRAAESDAESTLTRIARLTNPHVAALYDVGVADIGAERIRYAVSEWSAGHTLGDLMESGPLPWPRVADWGRQTSAGLAALHAIGVTHGALSPDSLAVFDDRRVKIMGAGLEHTALEQTMGARDSAADDVRALGELIWRGIAGVPPVEPAGTGAAADAGRRLNSEPLREAGTPPVLIELLIEMLAADPAARPTAATAEERIAPLVPIERAADTEAEPSTMPLVIPPPTEFGTRTDMQVRDYLTTPIPRGSAAPAKKRRSAGLLIGLALLLAALGVAVGLIIANNVGRTTAPPPVNVTVSGSTGTINLPTAAPTTSAPPTTATAAPPSSAPATSASPSASASPSPSESASSSPGSSASTNPNGPASASGTAIGAPSGGAGQPSTKPTK